MVEEQIPNSMIIENVLDHIHASVTRRWYLQFFTVITRCLLAFGFIRPSITKILHKPFTVLPDSNPVGHYFNALYATGFYYEFIGWAQITAAILLLFPRTAHIGALIFLPIIVNIAVLTCSVGFAGTWVITIFMGLAGAWLVAWEYDRLKPIVFYDREDRNAKLSLQSLVTPAAFAASGIVIAGIWAVIRVGNLSDYRLVAAILAAAGFLFGSVVALHFRYMPTGHLRKPGESI